ncbi:hypothetical protein R3P38DRAFT_2821035 [Favolaschia claudopus]|uniref:YCII-related domain-containing protein n=1 Tax=Favolaschia claudopus TaxID=2862362 RepID=A0AAW0EH98_9AGAR
MARKFVFFGPYITTPEAKELRARIHTAHVNNVQKLLADKIIKFGGPFYNDDGAGENSSDRAFGGSFFLMEAESREQALKIVQADPYYENGLWDIAKLHLVEYDTGPLPYPFA